MKINMKSMLSKIFKNSILFAVFTLVGANLVACDTGLSGQIEKCVQAGIAANGPYKDSADKASTEVSVRAYCLRAASGKD